MKLSVVMNTFNRRHALEKTLPSLLAQDQRPEDFEVVFVVDGSTDGTAELLNSWKTPFAIKVIVQPTRGMEVARNVGVAAARGEIVLFLDDDIICSPGVIRQHTEAHGDDVAVVAHGPIYVAPESPKSLIRYGTEQWYKSYYGRLNPAVGLQIPKEIYLLANSSLSRKLLVESGGFDEQTPELGDIELGLRLAKMGIRFRFLPAAIAYELFVKASGEFIGNQVSKWGKAQIYLCRKHPEYRPYSRLAVSAKSPGWRRLAREIVARFPVSAATLLKPALRLT